jgi:glycosyltransferase involved in cell wall biosynthesis
VSELISVIIPVRNGGALLARCLGAVKASTYRHFECIVVDDASTDSPAKFEGVQIITSGDHLGPAHARNLGVAKSTGSILLFVDADVLIQPDTLVHIAKAFADDPELDALYGSYDADPPESNFFSQYKNLMHCFVHQHGRRRASTFWTGCGAVRRHVFEESGGFKESYRRPSIEDIELGARLIGSGRKIELDPSLQVKHLKRWTFWGLLATDIRYRAIPWTLVMLRNRHIPNDLNVQWTQRWSVAMMCAALPLLPLFWPASCVAIAATIALNWRFYAFLAQRRGALFAFRAIPMHLFYFIYSGAAFAVACGMFVVSQDRSLWSRLSSDR